MITDRLHSMIFCAITGTPCVVINSKSPKVRGCYEWIKELDYIQFCDDINNFSEAMKVVSKGSHRYDNSKLMPYYEGLKTDILAMFGKHR